MTWTRAVHIQHWADLRSASGDLPLLIRRLIRSTVPDVQTLVFPAAEQVTRAGFDGQVEVGAGSQFVPTGKSRWETGTDKDKKTKAEKDFGKRTLATSEADQRESTYVAVTPRSWPSKDDWANEKKAASKWKDVVVLDANDLEHWLELAPATDLWFSVLCGCRPQGVSSLIDRWTATANLGESLLSPDVFLLAREKAEIDVLQFLQSPPASVLIQSKSADASFDFLAALVAKNATNLVGAEGFAVISDSEAWRRLSMSRDRLTLIPNRGIVLSAADVADAVRCGHHVIICDSGSSIQNVRTIEVGELDGYKLAETLTKCGLPDSKAESVAQGCCGSSTILKRLLAVNPATDFPAWSNADVGAQLAPFALFGAWVHVDPTIAPRHPLIQRPPEDLLFLQEFLRRSVDEIERTIERWSVGDEPLFRRFGTHVVIASREDAWYLLGGYLTTDHLQRFESIAELVLGENDPAFQLSPETRWLANLHGKVFTLSQELRRAILESMALMMTIRTAKPPGNSIDFGSTCRRIFEQVLPRGASWERWASLNDGLELLAECDPDVFLQRIEQDLASAKPQTPELFRSQPSHFSRCLHANLLWALERLSWNPAFLPRVLAALCKLSDLAEISNWGNTPDSSAREILYFNHTANDDELLGAIRHMTLSNSNSAWSVLASMLPSPIPSYGTKPQLPRWRAWANQWVRRGALEPKLFATILDLLGNSYKRWAVLAPGLLRWRPIETRQRLAQVVKPCEEAIEGKSELWDSLRRCLHYYQLSPANEEENSKELVEDLMALVGHLKPRDAIRSCLWLFENHVEVPEVPRLDFDAQRAAIHDHRRSAVCHVLEEQGPDGVLALALQCSSPSDVGWTAGTIESLAWAQIAFPGCFASDSKFLQFATAFAAMRFSKSGLQCLPRVVAAEWTPDQLANLALAFRFSPLVWDWLDGVSSDAARLYWGKCRARYGDLEHGAFEKAIGRLITAGRPYVAIEMVQAQQSVDISDGQIADLLRSGAQSVELPDQHQQWALCTLIKKLQESSLPVETVAQLEWLYLPLLVRPYSQTQPRTLTRAVVEQPEFFLLLVEAIRRGKGSGEGSAIIDDARQVRGEQAETLLRNIFKLPTPKTDEPVDYPALARWARRCLSLAAERELGEICKHQLGVLLGNIYFYSGGAVPAEISDLLEESDGEEMLHAFQLTVFNSRGITSRSPFDGGVQEYQLSEKYRKISRNLAVSHPRVSEIYERLSSSYESHARREDLEAERRKLRR